MASHLATGLLLCAKCGEPYSYKLKQTKTEVKSGGETTTLRHVYYHKSKTDCPAKPKEYKESVIDTALTLIYYDYLLKIPSGGAKIQLTQKQNQIKIHKQNLIAAIQQETIPSDLFEIYRISLVRRDRLLNETNPEYIKRQAYKSFLLFKDSPIDKKIELIKETLVNVKIISGVLTTGFIQKQYKLAGLYENFIEYLSLMESNKFERDRVRSEKENIEVLNINLLRITNTVG
jgi:hypothetical protein